MSDLERVYAHIDDQFDRHLDRVRAFVRQPSISGEGEGMEENPWAVMSSSAPISQAMVRTLRAFGREPEVWPNIGGSAPFYLFQRVLHQPFTMGGMGHGGRQHSPNEYATVEGIRLFEKSVARFVAEFAAIRE